MSKTKKEIYNEIIQLNLNKDMLEKEKTRKTIWIYKDTLGELEEVYKKYKGLEKSEILYYIIKKGLEQVEV